MSSSFESTWRIEILYRTGKSGYFGGWDYRGEPIILFDRDMALEYSDVIEAALDYAKIEAQGHGFSASIEVSKRFPGHSAAARLERFYAATLHSIAAE
ncbi:hypothetical protein [Rhizobium leguminosarum]